LRDIEALKRVFPAIGHRGYNLVFNKDFGNSSTIACYILGLPQRPENLSLIEEYGNDLKKIWDVVFAIAIESVGEDADKKSNLLKNLAALGEFINKIKKDVRGT